MNDRLTVKWTLTGRGWAQLELGVEGQAVVIDACYLSDAIRSFVEAVAAALDGLESIATFEDEPGQTRLLFHPIGNNVDLNVAKFPETFSKQALTSTKLVTLGRCTKLRLARVSLSAFDDLLGTHGARGYRDFWTFDFPESGMSELRSQFVKLKQANL